MLTLKKLILESEDEFNNPIEVSPKFNITYLKVEDEITPDMWDKTSDAIWDLMDLDLNKTYKIKEFNEGIYNIIFVTLTDKTNKEIHESLSSISNALKYPYQIALPNDLVESEDEFNITTGKQWNYLTAGNTIDPDMWKQYEGKFPAKVQEYFNWLTSQPREIVRTYYDKIDKEVYWWVEGVDTEFTNDFLKPQYQVTDDDLRESEDEFNDPIEVSPEFNITYLQVRDKVTYDMLKDGSQDKKNFDKYFGKDAYIELIDFKNGMYTVRQYNSKDGSFSTPYQVIPNWFNEYTLNPQYQLDVPLGNRVDMFAEGEEDEFSDPIEAGSEWDIIELEIKDEITPKMWQDEPYNISKKRETWTIDNVYYNELFGWTVELTSNEHGFDNLITLQSLNRDYLKPQFQVIHPDYLKENEDEFNITTSKEWSKDYLGIITPNMWNTGKLYNDIDYEILINYIDPVIEQTLYISDIDDKFIYLTGKEDYKYSINWINTYLKPEYQISYLVENLSEQEDEFNITPGVDWNEYDGNISITFTVEEGYVYVNEEDEEEFERLNPGIRDRMSYDDEPVIYLTQNKTVPFSISLIQDYFNGLSSFTSPFTTKHFIDWVKDEEDIIDFILGFIKYKTIKKYYTDVNYNKVKVTQDMVNRHDYYDEVSGNIDNVDFLDNLSEQEDEFNVTPNEKTWNPRELKVGDTFVLSKSSSPTYYKIVFIGKAGETRERFDYHDHNDTTDIVLFGLADGRPFYNGEKYLAFSIDYFNNEHSELNGAYVPMPMNEQEDEYNIKPNEEWSKLTVGDTIFHNMWNPEYVDIFNTIKDRTINWNIEEITDIGNVKLVSEKGHEAIIWINILNEKFLKPEYQVFVPKYVNEQEDEFSVDAPQEWNVKDLGINSYLDSTNMDGGSSHIRYKIVDFKKDPEGRELAGLIKQRKNEYLEMWNNVSDNSTYWRVEFINNKLKPGFEVVYGYTAPKQLDESDDEFNITPSVLWNLDLDTPINITITKEFDVTNRINKTMATSIVKTTIKTSVAELQEESEENYNYDEITVKNINDWINENSEVVIALFDMDGEEKESWHDVDKNFNLSNSESAWYSKNLDYDLVDMDISVEIPESNLNESDEDFNVTPSENWGYLDVGDTLDHTNLIMQDLSKKYIIKKIEKFAYWNDVYLDLYKYNSKLKDWEFVKTFSNEISNVNDTLKPGFKIQAP